MHKLTDNRQFMLNLISTVSNYRKTPQLNEAIVSAVDDLKDTDVASRDNFVLSKILKDMNRAIIAANEPDDVIMADVIRLHKSRETEQVVDLAIKALDQPVSSVQMEDTLKQLVAHNKFRVISYEDNEVLLSLLTKNVSAKDMPETMSALQDRMSGMLQKLHREDKSTTKRRLSLGKDCLEGHKEVHFENKDEIKYMLKTGFAGIDEPILGGGILPASLIVIGSKGGGGKSALMMLMAMGVAFNKVNYKLQDIHENKGKRLYVLIVSYENTMIQCYRRVMSMFGYRKEYIASLTITELENLLRELFTQTDIGIDVWTDNARTQSASELAAEIVKEETFTNKKYLLVCHDYINLSKPENSNVNSNEFLEAGHMAQDIREHICKGLKKPVISATQIKKDAEEKVAAMQEGADKLPVRGWNGSSTFGGNVIKQKVDLLIFVLYTIINGHQYIELVSDKDRNSDYSGHGKADAITSSDMYLSNQEEFYKNLESNQTLRDMREFFGNDGRIGVAIPRKGLIADRTVYYADRFAISPESSAVSKMFTDAANRMDKEVEESE